MYKKNRHIHFIGIGGIGMSGIAAILRRQGYVVSGCDSGGPSEVIDHLLSLGCTVDHKHDPCHIHDADVLVYSSAVDQGNPEVLAALEKGIPVIPRAIMLAELMRMKYGVAVAGSHGKTTTTSMISHVLTQAQLDPTIVIGGVLKNLSTNAKLGSGDLLIAEADESDRSLLYLNPCMAIVTNIDAEHLDTYKDIDDIKETFQNFLARLPFYGKAFVCIDDVHIRSILPLSHVQTVKYGLSGAADIIGRIHELNVCDCVFDVYEKKDNEKKILGRVTLSMPGEYNVLNALATIALARELEISFDVIAEALATFKGVGRRFELKGTFHGAEVFDDYGHHPTEIQKTLVIAQRRAQKKLHVIFQPHRYSRTQALWSDFVHILAFGGIDTLIMTDVYPASEKPIPGINGKKLACEIQNKNPRLTVLYFDTYQEILDAVQPLLNEGDLVLTLGAGKANWIGAQLCAL